MKGFTRAIVQNGSSNNDLKKLDRRVAQSERLMVTEMTISVRGRRKSLIHPLKENLDRQIETGKRGGNPPETVKAYGRILRNCSEKAERLKAGIEPAMESSPIYNREASPLKIEDRSNF